MIVESFVAPIFYILHLLYRPSFAGEVKAGSLCSQIGASLRLHSASMRQRRVPLPAWSVRLGRQAGLELQCCVYGVTGGLKLHIYIHIYRKIIETGHNILAHCFCPRGANNTWTFLNILQRKQTCACLCLPLWGKNKARFCFPLGCVLLHSKV